MDITQLFHWFALLQGIAATYNSNEDVATKVKDIAGALWPEVAPFVKKAFPSVSEALAPAAVATIADHALVTRIQTALNNTGANLVVDGWYGDLTRTAVKAFQKAHDLTVDGWVGQETRKALEIAQ